MCIHYLNNPAAMKLFGHQAETIEGDTWAWRCRRWGAQKGLSCSINYTKCFIILFSLHLFPLFFSPFWKKSSLCKFFTIAKYTEDHNIFLSIVSSQIDHNSWAFSKITARKFNAKLIRVMINFAHSFNCHVH